MAARARALFVLSLAALALAPSAHAAGTLDQSYQFFDSGSCVGTLSTPGQTFTAGRSRTLDRIEVIGVAAAGSTHPVTLSVYGVGEDGLPAGTALATGEI